MAKGKQSALDRIKNAKAARGGNHFKFGKGRLVVKSIKEEDTYDGQSFIVEFEVLSSQSNGLGDGIPNAPGSSVSLVCMLEKHESAAAAAKAFILELAGAEEDEISDEDFEETYNDLTSDDQPGRGMVIDFDTREKMNQGKTNPANKGKIMCMPIFEHVDQTPEQIAAQRAKLDKKGED